MGKCVGVRGSVLGGVGGRSRGCGGRCGKVCCGVGKMCEDRCREVC